MDNLQICLLGIFVTGILALLFYCFFLEKLKKEELIINGEIVKIIENEYTFFLPTPTTYDLCGVDGISVMSFSSWIEMVNVIIEVKSKEEEIYLIKLDMTIISFKKMNLVVGELINVNCYKRKYQKIYTYDGLLSL